MTISSSLQAGVSGLSANSSKLATIADNIANSGTYGYKRSETEFSSLVRTASKGAFTAGGTVVSTYRQVEAKGALIRTENSTDLSVTGRGMLPVTRYSALGGVDEPPLLLTATGSFEADAEGVLRTPGGLVLLGWPADTDGTVPPQPRDTVSGLEPVVVQTNQLDAEPTTRIEFGLNLPASQTASTASGDPLVTSVEYFGNLGTSEALTVTFTPSIPGTGSSNAWQMSISDSATAPADNPIAVFDIAFSDARLDGGYLNSVTVPGGGVNGESYDPINGLLQINVDGGPIDINVGVLGEQTLLSQLEAEFAPISVSKDGAAAGTLAAVEIDENGYLQAVYDTGFAQTLYQIPLADVPNLNGLTALDNQAFAISTTSGSFYLWDAGEGPTGSMVSFAKEESNTDLAGELTDLIQTQRAYSSNAKIIQTVDEMLQETTNIKR